MPTKKTATTSKSAHVETRFGSLVHGSSPTASGCVAFSRPRSTARCPGVLAGRPPWPPPLQLCRSQIESAKLRLVVSCHLAQRPSVGVGVRTRSIHRRANRRQRQQQLQQLQTSDVFLNGIWIITKIYPNLLTRTSIWTENIQRTTIEWE